MSASPNTVHATSFLRTLALLNGAFAGLWTVLSVGGLLAIASLLSAVVRGKGLGLVGGIFILLVVGAFALMSLSGSVWLLFVARRLWQGYPRGIANLLQVAWYFCVLSILVTVAGGRVWGVALDPVVRSCAVWVLMLVGMPPALYSGIHLWLLAPWKQKITAIAVMVLAPAVVAGTARWPQTALANAGRIHCPGNEFTQLVLTSTGHVVSLQIGESRAGSPLTIFDFQSCDQVAQVQYPHAVNPAVSRQGNRLVARRAFGTGNWSGIVVGHVPSGAIEAELPEVANLPGVDLVQLSHDGSRLAVISTNWDDHAQDPRFEPQRGFVQIFSLPDGKLLHEFRAVTGNRRVSHATLDANGQLIAIATDAGKDGQAELSLWSLATPSAELKWRRASDEAVYVMGFDITAAKLHTLYYRGELVSYELASGKELACHKLGHAGFPADFSQNGQFFGQVKTEYKSRRNTRQVEIFDLRAGQQVKTLSLGPEAAYERSSTVINLDIMKLIVLNSQTLWLHRWDLERGIELRK